MWSRILYCLLMLLSTTSADWDVVISEVDFLDFLYRDGRNVSVHQGSRRSGGNVNSLAFDPIYENLYFSDSSDTEFTHIKMMEVTKEAVVSSPYPVISLNSSNLWFHDLAHDPVTKSLFWTTTDIPYTVGQIWQAELKTPVSVRPLISIPHQTPRGVAVDSCQGYVYWANWNRSSPSIDRLRLNDSAHETFLSKALDHRVFAPSGLAISQNDRKLYWVDKESYIHIIRRSSLDKGDVEEFLELTDGHEPNALAVTGDALYFTETGLDAVFVVRFNDPYKTVRKLNHTVFKPQGIAVRDQLSFLTQANERCAPLASLRKQVPPRHNITVCLFGEAVTPPLNGVACACWPGYSGLHCETNACHNFCLGGERCYLVNGQPTCECPSDRTGPRCELERCRRTCLNGGTLKCNSSASSQGVCACPAGFYGPSCETPSTLCDLYCHYGEDVAMPNVFHCPCSLKEASWVPPRYATSATIGLLAVGSLVLLLCIALVWQTKRLKSRPKIFKRYSVTPKPATSPSCEIAIENCCNMNICDTPCYEPDLRTLETDRNKSKKEEKRGLLDNDVLAQSSSCRTVPDF